MVISNQRVKSLLLFQVYDGFRNRPVYTFNASVGLGWSPITSSSPTSSWSSWQWYTPWENRFTVYTQNSMSHHSWFWFQPAIKVLIFFFTFYSLQAGKFCMLLGHLLILLQIYFKKKSFRNTVRISNSSEPDRLDILKPDLVQTIA